MNDKIAHNTVEQAVLRRSDSYRIDTTDAHAAAAAAADDDYNDDDSECLYCSFVTHKQVHRSIRN